MKRTITPASDGTYELVTTNGINTTTRTVYVRQLKEYEPLPNGYNEALARDVIDEIKAHPALWEQESWRHFLFDSLMVTPATPAVKLHLAQENANLPKEVETTFCGTAMCCAGWVAELSGADYVIDVLDAIEKGYSTAHQYADQILVPKAVINESEWLMRRAMNFTNLPMDTQERLHTRGFTGSSHAIVTVDTYACWRLGLVDGDWLELFEGTNTIDQLEDIIDAYAKAGPREIWVDNTGGLEDEPRHLTYEEILDSDWRPSEPVTA